MSDTPIDPSLRQLATEIAEAMVAQLWARMRTGEVPIPPEYLSPRQVQLLTGIPTKSLEAMRSVRQGPPYYKVGDRRVRYKLEDIRKWIESDGPVE